MKKQIILLHIAALTLFACSEDNNPIMPAGDEIEINSDVSRISSLGEFVNKMNENLNFEGIISGDYWQSDCVEFGSVGCFDSDDRIHIATFYECNDLPQKVQIRTPMISPEAMGELFTTGSKSWAKVKSINEVDGFEVVWYTEEEEGGQDHTHFENTQKWSSFGGPQEDKINVISKETFYLPYRENEKYVDVALLEFDCVLYDEDGNKKALLKDVRTTVRSAYYQ